MASMVLAALWAFSSAHSYLDMAAKMTAAWKIDLEGLMVVHEMRTSRRPWVQADSRSPHALEPNTALKLLSLSQESCPRRSKIFSPAGSWVPNTRKFGPSNDTPIPDQSIRRRGSLVPILPRRPC